MTKDAAIELPREYVALRSVADEVSQAIASGNIDKVKTLEVDFSRSFSRHMKLLYHRSGERPRALDQLMSDLHNRATHLNGDILRILTQ